MGKKEIFLILFLTLFILPNPVSAEDYVPNQEAVKALNEVKEVIISLPKDASLSSSVINSLIGKCEEIVKTDEKFAEGHLYLGICYLAKENFDKTIEAGSNVIGLNAKKPDGYFVRGLALMLKSLKQGSTSFVEPITDFEKVISIDPDYRNPTLGINVAYASKILLLVGNMHMKSNQIEKAKESFTILVEKYPESPDAEIAAKLLKGFQQQTLIKGQVRE